ncbi:MAG: hypothetical protein ACTSYR_02055 [Candidatus Odinarchaeia archaeon]
MKELNLTPEQINEWAIQKVKEFGSISRGIEEISQKLVSQADMLTKKDYAEIQNKVSGWYTYAETLYNKLNGLVEVFLAKVISQLRLEAKINGEKFVAQTAEKEATHKLNSLILAESIVKGWVKSAKNIIRTCRCHFYGDKEEEDEDRRTL